MSDDIPVRVRLDRLEGQVDALKVVRPLTITVVSVILAALVFVLGFMSLQIQATNSRIAALDSKIDGRIDATNGRIAALESKIDGRFDATGNRITALESKIDGRFDAIPKQLSDEFRAMRAEMSAQTSAIANAITATRQSPPQVILMPAPQAVAPPSR